MSKHQGKKLRIGITIGDVNGIGPELIIKTFQDQRMKERFIPILYGSARVINIYRKVLQVEKFHYVMIQNPSQAHSRKLNIIECMPDLERVDIGKPSDIGGKAAYLSVQRAVKDAQHKEIDALVTLPVNKATFQQQDPNFKGHTELFAEAFNQSDNLMFMVSEALRVGTVTNHLPLSEVARNISTERIINKVSIMHKSLENDFNIQRPMIAVLGLNPHAGDNGLIGPEEKDIVQPAITELKKRGMRVYGPYPADGIFGSSGYRKFDGIMSMYHDQGLIPFKLISGYEGVNFTAGIPLVRTSPDHGVAYDIAGKGEANPESLRQAIYVAMDVFRNREMNHDLAANALTSTQELRKKIVTTAEDTEED